jgi:hypothetical protein
MNTSCQYCIFKQMLGKRQTGCQLGRIAKWKSSNVTLTRENKAGQTHFIINDKLCNMLRVPEWGMKNKGQNLKELVRKEVSINMDTIMLVEEWHTIDDIKLTLDSIIQQNLKPRTIRMVVNVTGLTKNILDLSFDTIPEGILWKIDEIIERTSEGNRLMSAECLDIIAYRIESPIFAVFLAGFKVPQTFIEDIDVAINDRLIEFSLLMPDSFGNGLVVQTEVYKTLSGCHPMEIDGEIIDNLPDKVRAIAKQNNMEYMVQNVSDICSPMKICQQ